jgi:hypothetical protein
MDGKITWVPVDISEGMFSNEYAVSLKNDEGLSLSFYVDKELIKKEKDKNFLKVIRVHLDEKKGKQTILLPSETFETSSRWVNISI